MANKVKFGLCNVHIAPIIALSNNGITYDTPFALPGAVNLTLDPEGESADFFGDNTKYFSEYANQGYSGSLEIALINDAFRTKVLGETTDSNGAMIESTDDTIKDFALGFQINGDKTNRKYWFYNVSAQRPSTASNTMESSKEPNTDTLNITANARINDNKVKVFLEETEDNKTAYANFFNEVYESIISG